MRQARGERSFVDPMAYTNERSTSTWRKSTTNRGAQTRRAAARAAASLTSRQWDHVTATAARRSSATASRYRRGGPPLEARHIQDEPNAVPPYLSLAPLPHSQHTRAVAVVVGVAQPLGDEVGRPPDLERDCEGAVRGHRRSETGVPGGPVRRAGGDQNVSPGHGGIEPPPNPHVRRGLAE